MLDSKNAETRIFRFPPNRWMRAMRLRWVLSSDLTGYGAPTGESPHLP